VLLTKKKKNSSPPPPAHLAHLGYGRHLSRDEADALVRPVAGAFDTVESWLESEGLRCTRARHADGSPLAPGTCVRTGDAVRCRATAAAAERLFAAPLHTMRHRDAPASRRTVLLGALTLPEEVATAVSLVTGLSELGDPRDGRRGVRVADAIAAGAQARLAGFSVDIAGDGAGIGVPSMTPADVRLFHKVPPGLASRNPMNRLGVAGFGSTFSQRSLAAFQDALGIEQHNVSLVISAAAHAKQKAADAVAGLNTTVVNNAFGPKPHTRRSRAHGMGSALLHNGDGGDSEAVFLDVGAPDDKDGDAAAEQEEQSALPVTAESDLDVQYAMAVSPGTPTWFFEQSGAEWLLALLDDIDSHAAPPWVVSLSYAWAERDSCTVGPGAAECSRLGYTSRDYVDRANAALAKIGARGVTVVAASGDSGASGGGGNCPRVDLGGMRHFILFFFVLFIFNFYFNLFFSVFPIADTISPTAEPRRVAANRCPQVRMIRGGVACNYPSASGAVRGFFLSSEKKKILIFMYKMFQI
jgi:hypothetical protein